MDVWAWTGLRLYKAAPLPVQDDIRENPGSSSFMSVIFRDSQFVEAASYEMSLLDYNLDAKGARSFWEQVREVLYGQT